MKKSKWVESKPVEKKQRVVLDVTRNSIRSISDVHELFELFAEYYGDIPDDIIMSEDQYYWYEKKLRDFLKKPDLIVRPRAILGMRIIINDRSKTS